MYEQASPIFTPKENGDATLHTLLSKPGTSHVALIECLHSGNYANSFALVNGIKEYPLHTLFRVCAQPLKLFDFAEVLLNAGAKVNQVDGSGCPSVYYLLLHINRGLMHHRFQPQHIVQLKEQMFTPKATIEKMIAEMDQQFQPLVYKTLELMIEKGAFVDFIPPVCPKTLQDYEWSSTFERKLITQDNRWKLLGVSANFSMSCTTYAVFDPLGPISHHNREEVTTLHIVASRGDAKCLKLVLEHISDQTNINARTKDGRNALHCLFQYCNKPLDLVKCTQTLIDAGIDIDCKDKPEGYPPVVHLLYHLFTKRSYIRFLANSYNLEELNMQESKDNFLQEIEKSVKLLLGNMRECPGKVLELPKKTLLHIVYEIFEKILRGVSRDFQNSNHPLTPYTFSVVCLYKIVPILIELGVKVDGSDNIDTPLIYLTHALNYLEVYKKVDAHPNEYCTIQFNSTFDLVQCYRVLLENGANPNAVSQHRASTACHLLVQMMYAHRNAAVIAYALEVIALLAKHNADVNIFNLKNETPLSIAIRSVFLAGFTNHQRYCSIPWRNTPRIVTQLLRCGADPDMHLASGPFLINLVIKEVNSCRIIKDIILQIATLLCNTMSHTVLQSAVAFVQCNEHCEQGDNQEVLFDEETHAFVAEKARHARSLKHLAKLCIWRSMGSHYQEGCFSVDLPKSLAEYLFDMEAA